MGVGGSAAGISRGISRETVAWLWSLVIAGCCSNISRVAGMQSRIIISQNICLSWLPEIPDLGGLQPYNRHRGRRISG